MMGILMICVGLAAGLAAAAVPGLPKQWLDKAAAQQWLAAHPGGASFVSRGGVLEGGDSDAAVELTPPNKVEVTEFGGGIGTFTGSYDVNDAGEITLHLEGYYGKWPVMHLYAAPRDAWLMRTDMKTGFSLGGNSGDRNFGGTPFWPSNGRGGPELSSRRSAARGDARRRLEGDQPHAGHASAQREVGLAVLRQPPPEPMR